MRSPHEIWRLMASAPRDGAALDVLCRTADGRDCVVENLHYGYPPMGRGALVLRGGHNVLSPYFTPRRWRPSAPKRAAP